MHLSSSSQAAPARQPAAQEPPARPVKVPSPCLVPKALHLAPSQNPHNNRLSHLLAAMLQLRARAFPSSRSNPLFRRFLATPTALPQTYIEKVVQRHAVGLPEGKIVRAGDYVMIRPEHVMTHVSFSGGIGALELTRATAGQHWTGHLQVGSEGALTRSARLTSSPQVQVDWRHQDLQPPSDGLHARPRRPEPLVHQPLQVLSHRGVRGHPRDRLLPRWTRNRPPDHD